MTTDNPTPSPAPENQPRAWPAWPLGTTGTVLFILLVALFTFLIAALLVSIFQRRQEARRPFVRVVEVDEWTDDPAIWGRNWPRQYDSYRRTADLTHTRYGGSDGITDQRLERDPWLKKLFAGHAFSLDYRDRRGHAYMLVDQEETERMQRPQPGACLHCHSAVMPAYRYVGEGDVMAGFAKVSAMPYHEARNLTTDEGRRLIEHPVTCLDCHDPDTMQLRVTRPAFINGIRDLKAGQGIKDYDPNRDATRQEMRSFVCGQCHVEYYFRKGDNLVIYPWHKGLTLDAAEQHYDEIGFSDWNHGMTGGGMLKAQHPEFEMWSQGIHGRAGVACADCHMPYIREGAMKVSDHGVRSPLLMINRSCQPCHSVSERELEARVLNIQDKTRDMIVRAGLAYEAMVDTMVQARARGVSDQQLAPAIALQRKAGFRLDWVYAENSMGFHAPQETARLLLEAIDYSRQGQLAAQLLFRPTDPVTTQPAIQPVIGVTPSEQAPKGPATPGPGEVGPR
jgi:nitrite reductase (cytochrome c-552)